MVKVKVKKKGNSIGLSVAGRRDGVSCRQRQRPIEENKRVHSNPPFHRVHRSRARWEQLMTRLPSNYSSTIPKCDKLACR